MILHDFTKLHSLEVRQAGLHNGIAALVNMTQSAGSMHFQFSMTPDQARQLAQALDDAADEAERRQDEADKRDGEAQ